MQFSQRGSRATPFTTPYLFQSTFVEHFLVAVVMAVGHQVTGRFPAFDVAGGNRPGGAGQLAFAGEKLLVNRRAEDGEPLAPLLDLRELLRASSRA